MRCDPTAYGTAAGHLALLHFVPADERRCRADEALTAFTVPGSRVIHICGSRYADRFSLKTRDGELLLIHELLHALGLGEKPPTTWEITAMVRERCGWTCARRRCTCVRGAHVRGRDPGPPIASVSARDFWRHFRASLTEDARHRHCLPAGMPPFASLPMWSDFGSSRICTVHVYEDCTATVEMRAAGRIVLVHPCDNLDAALAHAETLRNRYVPAAVPLRRTLARTETPALPVAG